MAAGDRIEETFGAVTIIRGDAFDEMARLAGRADVVLTDPPYRLTNGGRGTSGDGSMSGMFDADVYSNSGDLFESMAAWRDIAGPLFRLAQNRSQAYVMANSRNVSLAQEALTNAGYHFHNLLVWGKNGATANRWYMKNCEFCLFFGKGKARTIANPGDMALINVDRVNPSEKRHPTQKPVELLRVWIRNSAPPGGLVIDPFAGSGSTGIAAAKEGRRAILVERDEGHFERLREWVKSLPAEAPAES